LDIAVVLRETGKALVLVEIEESTDTPKVLLGDVLATLLGDRITFREGRNLEVGEWTALIVLARSKGGSHQKRADFLENRIAQLKPFLSTPNASIGGIVVDLFKDERELESKLITQVERALAAEGKVA